MAKIWCGLLLLTLVFGSVDSASLVHPGRWRCPSAWEQHGDQCYFWELGQEQTWHQAKSYCSGIGAHMLKITNEEENAYIHNHVAGSSIWLGLHDLYHHNDWQWEADGTKPKFTSWFPGEPNNVGEDCGTFNGLGFGRGRWGDISCNSRALYICETTPLDGAPCPMSPQWSKYRNSCYYLSKQSKTWSEARTHCQLMDGDLAIIETPEENHILEGISPVVIRWIGLNDLVNEGQWVWLDQTREVFWTNWNSGQPNNHDVGLQHCGVTNNRHGHGGRWSSEQCQSSWPYLCQKEKLDGSACTEGWWEQESYCYAIFPDPLPWAMAALNCARWNSTLVTIKSKADQTIINRFLSHTELNKKTIWTGLNNFVGSPENETFWKWLGEFKAAASYNFTHWDTNEPRHDGVDACVMMHATTHNRGKWQNSHCLLQRYFICEGIKQDANDTCPEGWKEFQGHCYVLVDSKKAIWWSARWLCHITSSLPSFLVTITSQEEQQFINNELLGKAEESRGLWIGLSARYLMNQYIWLDNREPLTYTNWGFRQPNPVPVESCVILYPPPSWTSEMWRDVECMEGHLVGCQKHAVDTFYDFKFKDGVYRLVHKSFRKDTASAVCAKLLGDGASLAVIEDIDEWQFIQAELMAHFHIVTDHLWIEDVDPVQLNLTILTNPSLTTMEHGFDITTPTVCHQLARVSHEGSYTTSLFVREDDCCNKRPFLCEKRVQIFDVYDFSYGAYTYMFVTDRKVAQFAVDAACKSQFGDTAGQVVVQTVDQLLAIHREIKVRHTGGEMKYWVDLKIPKFSYVSLTNVSCFAFSFHNVQHYVHVADDLMGKSLLKVDCGTQLSFLCQRPIERTAGDPFDNFGDGASKKRTSGLDGPVEGFRLSPHNGIPKEQRPTSTQPSLRNGISRPSPSQRNRPMSDLHQERPSSTSGRGRSKEVKSAMTDTSPVTEWDLDEIREKGVNDPTADMRKRIVIKGTSALSDTKKKQSVCSGSCLGMVIAVPILAIFFMVVLYGYRRRYVILRRLHILRAEDENLTDTPLRHQNLFVSGTSDA